MDGHHRPVLWPRDVGYAHRVPENHIAVDERAVRLDPSRQPIAARSLIHELAGRVLLGRVIGGDPQMRPEEASPREQGRAGQEKWRAVLSRLEDVGHRLAENVPGSGVHDLPEAARAGIEPTRRVASRPISVSVTRAAVTVREEAGATFTSRTVLAGPSTSMSRRKLNQC